jgi:ankyrin repeat protein
VPLWISEVRLLFELRRDVLEIPVQGGNYGTALQVASYSGNQQIVRLLLERGAGPNARGASFEILKMYN